MKPNSLKKNLLVIALAGVCIGAVTFALLLLLLVAFSLLFSNLGPIINDLIS